MTPAVRARRSADVDAITTNMSSASEAPKLILIGYAGVAGAALLAWLSSPATMHLERKSGEPAQLERTQGETATITIESRLFGLIEIGRERIDDVRSATMVDSRLPGSDSDTPPHMVLETRSGPVNVGRPQQLFVRDFDRIKVFWKIRRSVRRPCRASSRPANACDSSSRRSSCCSWASAASGSSGSASKASHRRGQRRFSAAGPSLNMAGQRARPVRARAWPWGYVVIPCAYGSRVAVTLVPPAHTTPPAFQYIDRSTTIPTPFVTSILAPNASFVQHRHLIVDEHVHPAPSPAPGDGWWPWSRRSADT